MMTQEQARKINLAVHAFAMQLGEEYGLRVRSGNLRYTPSAGTFSVRLVGEPKPKLTVSGPKTEREAIGRKFKIKRRMFEVIGTIGGKSRKFTLLAKRLPDGKRFKVPLRAVQEGIVS